MVHVHAQPVDATAVPDDLPGFRTLFSSVHHVAGVPGADTYQWEIGTEPVPGQPIPVTYLIGCPDNNVPPTS